MSGLDILVVDDSAVVRQTLSELLNAMPRVARVQTANDPFMAVEKIKKSKPDVMILDVEMPRMDGLTFLRKIMSQHPIPVIVCSTLTVERSETHLRALEYGAVDIITKPTVSTKQFLAQSSERMAAALDTAIAATYAHWPERPCRRRRRRHRLSGGRWLKPRRRSL